MMKQTSWILGIFIFFLPLLQSQALPRVGNGGGTWICQEHGAGDYRWVHFVDLYEAEAEFGWTLDPSPIQSAVEDAQKKIDLLRLFFPAWDNALPKASEFYKQIRFVPTSSSLTQIDDGNIRVRPSPESCQGGYLYYGQLANFTMDGRLLVSAAIWNSPAFSERSRSALMIHEIIYKILRETSKDSTSTRSRQIVGVLFSDHAANLKLRLIQSILSHPPPASEDSGAIGEPVSLLCSATIANMSSGKSMDETLSTRWLPVIKPGDSRLLSFGDFIFEVRSRAEDGIPEIMSIEDLNTKLKTRLDQEILRSVFLKKRRASVSMEKADLNQTIILSCQVQDR